MEAHYQILFIILLTEFMKLNANMDMLRKNVKCVELTAKIVSAVL